MVELIHFSGFEQSIFIDFTGLIGCSSHRQLCVTYIPTPIHWFKNSTIKRKQINDTMQATYNPRDNIITNN